MFFSSIQLKLTNNLSIINAFDTAVRRCRDNKSQLGTCELLIVLLEAIVNSLSEQRKECTQSRFDAKLIPIGN